jgi:Holliday junction resolvase
MSNKAKGSRVERELLAMFTEHSWRAARIAGSGVNDDSPADLIVGKMGKRGYCVECKSSKKTSIYITKEQIEDFILFSNMIGLTPVIAARFNYEGFIFLSPSQLQDSGKNWVINLKKAKEEGKKFSQFFES